MHYQKQNYSFSLGEYPMYSLAEAREMCNEKRKDVREGKVNDDTETVEGRKAFGEVALEWCTRQEL